VTSFDAVCVRKVAAGSAGGVGLLGSA